VPGRLVCRVAAALRILGLGGALTACYDVPQPDCGFGCGPLDACPEGYVCAADKRCHRIGAPITTVCNASDAGAGRDGNVNRPDAAVDAAIAGIDAPIVPPGHPIPTADAAIDAPDAPTDAPAPARSTPRSTPADGPRRARTTDDPS